MKTHLPKGLRAALVAALASVSLSTAYAYTTDEYANFAIDWSKIEFDQTVDITGKGDYGLNQYNQNINTKVIGEGNGKLSIVTESGSAGTQYVDVAADINSLSIMAPHTDPFDIYALSGNFSVRWKADGDESKTVGAVSIAEAKTGGYSTWSYLELDNPNYTYQAESGHSVLGVVGAPSLTQGVTLVIQNGTFEGTVTAGVSKSGLGGGTYNQATAGSTLQINGGTFYGMVVAGNSNTTNSVAQTNGTITVIRGGEFYSLVMGGNLGEKNNFRGYGASVCITGGTFHDSVYGAGAGGTIPIGVNMDILGGKFYNKDASTKSGIYALGSGGTVGKEEGSVGHLSLDIGRDAWFESGYTISAGSTNGDVKYYGKESTVRLTRITDSASSLATDSTITVDGGQQESDLMIENVTTAIKAKLTNFKSITVQHQVLCADGEDVTKISDLTLTQDTNAELGGAKSVTIVSGSALTLETSGKEDWKWGETTLSGGGTLKKTGEGQAVVQKAAGFTGDIAASGGTLQLDEVTLTTPQGRKVSVSNGATVNLVKVADGADAALKELNISGNGKVGVYLNGTPLAGENDANVGKLTLKAGNKIVIGTGGGTLEANLATQTGSILDFTAGAQLTMGCTLDVQDGTFIVLGDADYNTLAAGGSVTLFNGVDNVINPNMDASNLVICKGAAEGADRLTAEVYFYTDDQKHGILAARTPEPTTGTLSLLALAGLAARRRRKH